MMVHVGAWLFCAAVGSLLVLIYARLAHQKREQARRFGDIDELVDATLERQRRAQQRTENKRRFAAARRMFR